MASLSSRWSLMLLRWGGMKTCSDFLPITFMFITINLHFQCAPLLKYLGLVTPTEARRNVVKNYEQHMRRNTLVEFMRLLADSTFAGVDYGIIREKVSPLADITPAELEASIEAFSTRYPNKTPNLENIMSYVGSRASNPMAVHHDTDNAMSRSSRSLKRSAAAAAASSGLNVRGTVYDFRWEAWRSISSCVVFARSTCLLLDNSLLLMFTQLANEQRSSLWRKTNIHSPFGTGGTLALIQIFIYRNKPWQMTTCWLYFTYYSNTSIIVNCTSVSWTREVAPLSHCYKAWN